MKVKHLIACCLVSAGMWAGLGYLAGSIILAREGDVLANCHIYGDGECGPAAPWHGFVGAGE